MSPSTVSRQPAPISPRRIVSRAFDLVEEAESGRFYLGGRLFDLSRQLGLLLDCLAERPGWLVTTDLLQRHPQWEHLPHDEAGLRKAIHRLRARLGPEAAELIVARRGLGYCLRPDRS
jgi:DNA-binding response OmpR family regulator